MNAFSMEAVPVSSYKLLINGNEFDIPWSMQTGKISNVEVYSQSMGLTVSLERSEMKDDNLLITLPRNLIDTSGSQAEFALTVNDKQVSYEEVQSGPDIRVLRIPLTSDASVVHIVGTLIVPEFPVNSMVIAAIGLIGALVVLRLKSTTLISCDPNYKKR